LIIIIQIKVIALHVNISKVSVSMIIRQAGKVGVQNLLALTLSKVGSTHFCL